MDLAAGQRWTYSTPEGFAASRIVIGAVLTFAEREAVICCSVTDASRRLPDGTHDAATIAFVPLTETAFRQTVLAQDGEGIVVPEFQASFEEWRSDPRGLTIFTVPFEGSLDRTIAMQMAAILQQRPAA